MSEQPPSNPFESDKAVQSGRWKELAEQSQRVVEAFLEDQTSSDSYSIVDLAGIGRAFAQLTAKMLEDPKFLAQAQAQLWQESFKLWRSTAQRMLGAPAEPVADADRSDRRFRDKA